MPVDQVTVDFAVFGVSAIFLVKFFVNTLKSVFNITGKWALLLAFGVSAVLGVGNQLAAMYPGFGVWFKVAFYIVFAALGAAELYDNDKVRNETLALAKAAAALACPKPPEE